MLYIAYDCRLSRCSINDTHYTHESFVQRLWQRVGSTRVNFKEMPTVILLLDDADSECCSSGSLADYGSRQSSFYEADKAD